MTSKEKSELFRSIIRRLYCRLDKDMVTRVYGYDPANLSESQSAYLDVKWDMASTNVNRWFCDLDPTNSERLMDLLFD